MRATEIGESLLQEEIEIYSEKYDVHGAIRDYGFVTKLFFDYEGKKIEMGIHRNPLKREGWGEIGITTIESYIQNLTSHKKERKLQLHYWYRYYIKPGY